MSTIAVTSRSFSNHPVLRREIEKHYPKVFFNDTGKTLKGDELIAFLKDSDKAIIGLECLDASILNQLPKLKVISRFGVGLDMLDLNVMEKRGIKLAYAAGANKRSVSELVIALAINVLRHIPQANDEIRKGHWKQTKGRQLSGSTVGIIGLGAIGKDLAILLKSFNCKILIYDLLNQDEFCLNHECNQVDLNSLIQRSDIISLHVPLNESTQYILNARALQLMKTNAILINTARGRLVDEEALKSLLIKNKSAAAAFDVFSSEPPLDQELLLLPNFFSTPHIGGSTEEAIIAMGQAAIFGLENAIYITRN